MNTSLKSKVVIGISAIIALMAISCAAPPVVTPPPITITMEVTKEPEVTNTVVPTVVAGSAFEAPSKVVPLDQSQLNRMNEGDKGAYSDSDKGNGNAKVAELTATAIVSYCATPLSDKGSNSISDALLVTPTIYRADLDILRAKLQETANMPLDVFAKQDLGSFIKILGDLNVSPDGITSDAQKSCFLSFLKLGEAFANPPNACRVRNNEFPVKIEPPMWWFAMTFNEPYGSNNPLQAEGSSMKKEGNTVFPEACVVGYDASNPPRPTLATVQCKIFKREAGSYIEYRPSLGISPVITKSSVISSSGPITWHDWSVYFNGDGHIRCQVNLSDITDYASTGVMGTKLAPRWYKYTTFWMKATLWPETFSVYQPLAYFEPSDLVSDKESGALGFASVPENQVGSVLSVRLNGENFGVKIGPFTNTNQLQVFGTHFSNQNNTKIFTSWYRTDTKPKQFIPGDATYEYTQALDNVAFYPVGTFYIGYDPQTNTDFKGEIDEIIVDPSDNHSPT